MIVMTIKQDIVYITYSTNIMFNTIKKDTTAERINKIEQKIEIHRKTLQELSVKINQTKQTSIFTKKYMKGVPKKSLEWEENGKIIYGEKLKLHPLVGLTNQQAVSLLEKMFSRLQYLVNLKKKPIEAKLIASRGGFSFILRQKWNFILQVKTPKDFAKPWHEPGTLYLGVKNRAIIFMKTANLALPGFVTDQKIPISDDELNERKQQGKTLPKDRRKHVIDPEGRINVKEIESDSNGRRWVVDFSNVAGGLNVGHEISKTMLNNYADIFAEKTNRRFSVKVV